MWIATQQPPGGELVAPGRALRPGDLRSEDPLVDGMDLIDIIKRSTPSLPIIIITAYGTIETAEEAVQKGAY